MRTQRIRGAAAVVFAAASVLTGCQDERFTPRGQPGSPAPDYVAVSMAGDTVRLASLRGEVVLLNVWATWCPPCRKEIPELETLHRELAGEGLRVVGVSVDAAGAADAIHRFTQELGVSYALLHDPAEHVSNVFGVPGVPANFLIGRDGTLLWRHVGPLTADDPALRAVLEPALAEPRNPAHAPRS